MCKARDTGVVGFREALKDGIANVLKILAIHDDECKRGRRSLKELQLVGVEVLKV